MPCFFIGLAFLVQSCSPTYYVPNQAIISGLEKKGDFTSSFAMGDVRYGTVIGAQLDMGYAISDKIGIIGGTALAEELGSLSYVSRRTLGIGYNNKLDSAKYFRSYLISDFGETGVRTSSDVKVTSASYVAISVLSSLSKKTSFGEFSLGLGIKRLSYYNIPEQVDPIAAEFLDLRDYKNSFLIEPQAALFIGKGDLKFFAQLNQSLNLSHSNFPMKKAFFSLGLRWDLQF